jgi:hypothetical protein
MQKEPPVNVGLSHGLLFEPEDGGNMFLRNVGGLYRNTLRYKSEDHALKKKRVPYCLRTVHSCT